MQQASIGLDQTKDKDSSAYTFDYPTSPKLGSWSQSWLPAVLFVRCCYNIAIYIYIDLGCDSECPKLTPPNIQHFQIFQIFQYAHYAQYAQYAIKPSQAISNHLPSPRIQKLQPSPPKDQPKLWAEDAEDAEVEDVEAGDEMVEMWHDVTRVSKALVFLSDRTSVRIG